MGKPTAQNNNFINHFSHPHPLQLIPPTSSPPCSACKLAGGNGRVYSCRPCNFALHESCSKMKQVIKHPSHPSHTLTLLVAPVYNGGYFNCDGCGVNGTGFSYQCSLCDFDIHALCAYKPLSIIHNSHPQHSLKLAFHSPYGANKGFSCDVCLKIGTNQWLYRCIPCEFDAHIGCISAPHPNLLQHSSSAPTPHAPHAGHPHHQDNNRPRPGNMNRLNRPANNPTRPNRPVGNLNRPIGQNGPHKGPRRQNNNSGFDGPNGPITPSEVIGQVARQSFDQGSMEGSFYDGSAMNEEFDGEVDLEIDYEANGFECNEDGEANDEEQDVDGNGLEIVAYGDDANEVAYSESEFGGSSDARSQTNDLPDQADLYPMSVRTNRGPGGGRRQNSSPNSPAPRSNNMGRNGRGGRLQGSKNPIENPRGPQNRRAQNVRNNAARAGAPVGYNRPRYLAAGPQGFNGPSGGPSNIIDNGGNNNNYNEVYGNEVSAGEYGDTYGDEGDCGFEAGDDFEDGGDFEDDGYDQTYDETYGENDFECYSDFTGGSESMYNEDESYETMDDSQYNGLNDEPNNQFSSMVGPVGGPGMSNQNQYGQNNRRGRTGRYGRGGNMNQGANSTQPRTMGRSVQQRGNRGRYRGNRQPNGQRGGPNGPNGPNVNPMMNQMVQGLCQGLAMNLLIGDGSDVNSGAGDSGISSIMGGGFLGGESEF